ncbi:MAG: hypothetical protein WCK35_13555, partial [Chloroflexota bacterium]
MQNLTLAPIETLKLAKNAYVHGETKNARYWASLAATQDPNLEEAWLILAAVANPKASVGYLRHYLKINPKSQRALRGLVWAIERLESYEPDRNSNIKSDNNQQLTHSLPVTASQDAGHGINFQIPKQTFFFLLILISLFFILSFSIGVKINYQITPTIIP